MGSASAGSTTSGWARCGPTPYWNTEVGHHRGGRLGVDAAGDDPAAEAGHEHHGCREVRLGDLALLQPGRHRGIEEHEVRPQLRDEAPIERWREHLVDREEESVLAQLAQTSKPRVIDVRVGLAVDHPGEFPRVDAVAGSQRCEIEILRREHVARQRDEEHRGTGVLGERAPP